MNTRDVVITDDDGRRFTVTSPALVAMIAYERALREVVRLRFEMRRASGKTGDERFELATRYDTACVAAGAAQLEVEFAIHEEMVGR
jgi:hypothetical protein